MKSRHLGIEVTEGILSVKAHDGSSILIQELPMAVFEVFYRTWMASISMWLLDEKYQNADFISLYVACSAFREEVIHSLELLGIENPTSVLTPKQIEALLFEFKHDALSEGESTPFGAAFELHGIVPKVLPQEVGHPSKTNTPGRKSSVSSLTSSIMGGLRRFKSQVLLTFATNFPYQEFCGLLC